MTTDELQLWNTSFNNGFSTFKSGMNNLFGGVANLSNALTNPIFEAGCQISAISMSPPYLMANASRCYGYHGWGWGWYPPLFYSPLDYYIPFNYQTPVLPSSMQTCSCNSMNSSALYPQNGYSSFYTSGDDFSALNDILHPERKNNCGSAGTNTSSSTTSDTIQLVDKTGKDVTPNWYTNIENRKNKGEKISSNEERLCNNFKIMNEKYSLYQHDKNKQPAVDGNGNLLESSFYRKLKNLQGMLDNHDSNGVEKVLNACSSEELAAIEAMYPTFLSTTGVSSALTFREAVKNACLWTGCGWTGINTDQCERIFDTLDKGLMADPRAMARALYQAIKNHHSFCGLKWGIDDNRIVKLLKMTNGNKAFVDAVKEEYENIGNTMLSSDIGSSWTISNANKAIINEYL